MNTGVQLKHMTIVNKILIVPRRPSLRSERSLAYMFSVEYNCNIIRLMSSKAAVNRLQDIALCLPTKPYPVNSEPIQAVFELFSPNMRRNSVFKIPTEKLIPLMTKLHTNEAATTTQP